MKKRMPNNERAAVANRQPDASPEGAFEKDVKRALQNVSRTVRREAATYNIPVTAIENGYIVRILPDGKKELLRKVKKAIPKVKIEKAMPLR